MDAATKREFLIVQDILAKISDALHTMNNTARVQHLVNEDLKERVNRLEDSKN